MQEYTIPLDPAAAQFYHRIARNVQLPVEQVLADALFKLAGELSLESMRRPEH